MSATTRYEVSGWMKFAEVDVFDDGCQPDSATQATGTDRFAAGTVQLLVNELCAFVPFKTDGDSVQLDACEEPGRVDISGMETDAGDEPTAANLTNWKAGRLTLYYVTYTFQVEKVTREVVALTDAASQEPKDSRVRYPLPADGDG